MHMINTTKILRSVMRLDSGVAEHPIYQDDGGTAI